MRLKKKSKKLPLMKEILKVSQKKALPGWLEIDKKSLNGMVRRLPLSEELDQEVDLPLVVGYYSR